MSGSGGGLTTATYSALSGLRANEQKTKIQAGDIANADTNGYKGYDDYTTSVVTSASLGTGGVSAGSRLTADIQGTTKDTGVETDMLINGAGFFVVTNNAKKEDPTDPFKTFFTRAGSFRFDKDGFFENEAGFKLMGWKLDADGNLPATSSILESLEPVNFARTIYEPTPTSRIVTALNLNSEEEVAGKASITLNMLNPSTPDLQNAFVGEHDIITPGGVNVLQVGDGIKFRVNEQDYDFVYGGFLKSASIGGSNVGNLSSSGSFSLTLTTNKGTQTVTTDASITNLSTDLQVLQNIAKQINSLVDGSGNRIMKANVAPGAVSGEYYLMIAAGDGRQSIKVDPSDLVFTGTNNIGTNSHRFSSLSDLRNLLRTIPGVRANLEEGKWNGNNSETLTKGARITIFSNDGIYVDNYQAEGNSNFLAAFSMNQGAGNQSGYLSTNYDPYKSDRNMAGGAFSPHFNKGFSIYDSKGAAHEVMMSFMRVDTQKWAVEFHAIDPAEVDIPGRTDGLLQAGYIYFDGDGELLSFEPALQSAYSSVITDASAPIAGAALGDNLTITNNIQSNTFNYDPLTYADSNALLRSANTFSPAGNTITGTNGDIVNVTVGTGANQVQWSFRRSGTNDGEIIDSLVTQINDTFGKGALIAEKIINGAQIGIAIRARDITQQLSITNDAGNLTADFFNTLTAGGTATVAANNARFSNMYELASRINSVAGNAMSAQVLTDSAGLTYQLKLTPTTSFATSNFSFSATNTNNLVNLLGLEDIDTDNNLTDLDSDVAINWSPFVGSDPNQINLNWNAAVGNQGLQNYARSSAVLNIEQNGVQAGEISGITIDETGDIIAQFTNSRTKAFYKIPVALFVSPNNLDPQTGDVFTINPKSGQLNLVTSGNNGAGMIDNRKVEGSNVDIASKLANLIEAQKMYQANAQVLSIVNEEIEYLLNRAFN
jgi:flagellar hook protein FlgE